MDQPATPTRPDITLTPQAIVAARRHQDTHALSRGKSLRIWIADKNCDGLIFGVAFDYAIDGDLSYRFESLDVLVDTGTARYLNGAVVDFVDDERGKGFVVSVPSPEQYQGKFFLKQGA